MSSEENAFRGELFDLAKSRGMSQAQLKQAAQPRNALKVIPPRRSALKMIPQSWNPAVSVGKQAGQPSWINAMLEHADRGSLGVPEETLRAAAEKEAASAKLARALGLRHQEQGAWREALEGAEASATAPTASVRKPLASSRPRLSEEEVAARIAAIEREKLAASKVADLATSQAAMGTKKIPKGKISQIKKLGLGLGALAAAYGVGRYNSPLAPAVVDTSW